MLPDEAILANVHRREAIVPGLLLLEDLLDLPQFELPECQHNLQKK